MNDSLSSDKHAVPFDPGVEIRLRADSLDFEYGPGIFGPPSTELRSLDAIRPSLRDPRCDGPDPVYGIAMDIGRSEHIEELKRRMLLFGAVVYAAGSLGHEPVRSQGHVHAIASHCGWSTPELFEIWMGRAIVYLQEHTGDDPGRCIAIEAGPGDQVIAPPGWAHYVVNADPATRMLFGACCDRQYGFVYDEIRARGGLAWFPELQAGGGIAWKRNERYSLSTLAHRSARSYPELGLSGSVPIYEQFASNPETVQWVSNPASVTHLWKTFEA